MPTRVAEQLLTAEEFAQMPESRGAELVRGKIVWPGTAPGVAEETLNSWKHASMVARLGAILLDFAIPRRLGQVYTGDPGMIIGRDPDTARGPDVAFVAAARVAQVPADGFSNVVADLVAEVVSPSDTAAAVEAKVFEFLEAGVRLVWVVNPIGNRITEYRGAAQVRVLGVRDLLEGHDILPTFRYPVQDVFDVNKSPRYPGDQ